MKRRWRLAIALGVLLGGIVVVPIAYIEGGCRAPTSDLVDAGDQTSLLPVSARRPMARTFLTYPEWHIVYEAEAYGRHLAAGRPPSAFPFGTQIAQFWTSYCAVNRLTSRSPDAGDAKITIYTIGISYSLELVFKAIYERTAGRLFEWLGGWTSADDRYAARVQQSYGRFMHQTPWYRFPFGEALDGEWRTGEAHLRARHWERRFALSAEYGLKAAYAKAIDTATGATVGRDDLTLQFVARATPAQLSAIDPRLKPVRTLPGGFTVAEAPRYEQFNELVAKLAARQIELVEIAGNRRILVTLLRNDRTSAQPTVLMTMPIDRPGWSRIGVTEPVGELTEFIRRAQSQGDQIEHVYDY